MVYMANGTKQPLYGTTIENALDNAGYSLEFIQENVRDHREGFDDSLEFIKGKWYPKVAKVKIPMVHPNLN